MPVAGALLVCAAAGTVPALVLPLLQLTTFAMVVVAVLGRPVELRLGALFFLVGSDALHRSHLYTGVFPLLLTFLLLRDLGTLRRRQPPAWLAILLVSASVVIALAPGRYGFSFAAGLAAFAYSCAALAECRTPTYPLVAGVAGGVIGTMANYVGEHSNYVVNVQGGLVDVIRSVQPGVDPNASAGLLLLGFGMAVALLRRSRGPLVLLSLGSAVAIAVGIAFTNSRSATAGVGIVAAAGLLAAPKSGRVSGRRLLMTLGIAGMAYGLVNALRASRSTFRFDLLPGDASFRIAIYRDWLQRDLSTIGSFVWGIPESHFEGFVPPHNSILEILSHTGLIGVVTAVLAVVMLRSPRRGSERADIVLRGAGLSIFLLGMSIGLSNQYLFWVGLALLVGPPLGDAFAPALADDAVAAPARWAPSWTAPPRPATLRTHSAR